LLVEFPASPQPERTEIERSLRAGAIVLYV
jgi:hypothetical protein